MNRPLILVAASGLAREALEAVRAQSSYDVIGYADDDPAHTGDVLDGVIVLGGLGAIADHPDAAVLICAGGSVARRAIVDRLALDAARYAKVVHPSVQVPRSCEIGPGSLLLAGCVLTASVTLGRHVVAMPHVTLTHDDVVEDFATLCAGVTLGGSVHVGSAAYLGMSSSVREGVRVGTEAVIGMGGVALRDVPDGETWIGNPARTMAGPPRRMS